MSTAGGTTSRRSSPTAANLLRKTTGLQRKQTGGLQRKNTSALERLVRKRGAGREVRRAANAVASAASEAATMYAEGGAVASMGLFGAVMEEPSKPGSATTESDSDSPSKQGRHPADADIDPDARVSRDKTAPARVPFLRIPEETEGADASSEIGSFTSEIPGSPVSTVRLGSARVPHRLGARSLATDRPHSARPRMAAAVSGSGRIVSLAQQLHAETQSFQRKLSPRLRRVIRGHKAALRPRTATVQTWEIQDERSREDRLVHESELAGLHPGTGSAIR